MDGLAKIKSFFDRLQNKVSKKNTVLLRGYPQKINRFSKRFSSKNSEYFANDR